MTTPRQARDSSGDGPRIYPWPPQPPHEFELISVTSAIKGGLPKPYLVGWAAKMAAECAWDDWDVLELLRKKKAQTAFLDHVKGARFRDMRQKGHRGTIVHAAVEAYIEGKPLTEADVNALLDEKRVDEKLRKATWPMAQGVLSFLDDAEPEILLSEKTVYSREHGYAGTTDVMARMSIGGRRLPTVIDVKSSKSIYDETALQLTAYARADFVGLDDGTEAPMPFDEAPEYGVVVRPTARGTYDHAVFALTDDVFDLFLACLRVANLDGAQTRARRPK